MPADRQLAGDARRPPGRRHRAAGRRRGGAAQAGGRRRQRFLPQPPLHRLGRPPGGVRPRLAGAARAPAAGLVAGARRRAGDSAAAGGGLAAAGGLDAGRRGAVLFRRPVRPGAADPRRGHRPAALERHTLDHPDMPEAVRLEVPDWLLPHLRARFGAALAAEMAAMDAEAPLDLRVNLLKATREQAQAALAAEGIEAVPTPLSPWGLRVAGRRPVSTGAAFQSGLVEIQDEGSQLVAALVGARPDMRVADWCAGAGGKTLALAMTMDNRGHIAACDVSAPRLDGRGAPAAPGRRAQCRAPSGRARRQMGQAPRRQLRPRAGGRALHRHRHLAAQPRRAAAPAPGGPRGTGAETGGDPGPGRTPGSQRRAVWSTLPARCCRRRTRPRWTPSSPPMPISRRCRWRGPGACPARRPAPGRTCR